MYERAPSDATATSSREAAHVDMRSSVAVVARAGASARAGRTRASREERRASSTRRARATRVSASPELESRDLAPWTSPGYRGAVVSALDENAQTACVLAVWSAILLGTYGCCEVLGPATRAVAPTLAAWSATTWPAIGLTYIAAGVAHFTVHDGFVSMMPHKGAWGFWNLPGSASFHVNWTGVAEILGGFGLICGSLPFGLTPDFCESWLTPASAAGLFLLTVVVTPANTYMWTHNSPGPLPPNADESAQILPWQGHLARAGLQIFLLTLLHGLIVR